jgi:hypothetical protein
MEMQTMFDFKRDGETEELYRQHIVNTYREHGCWVAHWALPDHSTPQYPMPCPYPHVRFGGGFLRGPYGSQATALMAAKHAVDENFVFVGT